MLYRLKKNGIKFGQLYWYLLSFQKIFMAARNKNLVKKINPILPVVNENAINKPAKKVLIKKVILKKTRIEVVKKGVRKN